MTSKEQISSRLNLSSVGNTPVFPRDLTLGLDALNIPTAELFQNGYNSELSAKAVLALQKITNHDAVVGCIHSVGFDVEPFGGVMKYPSYGIPYVEKHPFSSPDVLYSADRNSVDYSKIILSYDLVKSSADELAVFGNMEGPLTKAGILRGLENFMMDLNADPSYASDLIDFAVELEIQFLEELFKNHSADAVFIAAASDNPDIIGPELYKSLSLSNLKLLANKTHNSSYPIVFHPHGCFSSENNISILDQTISLGIDGFQFAEDNDPEIILHHTKNKCAILGGMDVANTLLLGSNQNIIRECDAYMDVLAHENYVFMCSCSLHRGIPIENLKVMVDAVKSYDNQPA